MKVSIGFLVISLATTFTWCSPTPPKRHPALHSDTSDYVPPGFEHMSLNHDYVTPLTQPIVHGYEHLIPHFNPELQPNVIHHSNPSNPHIVHGYEHLIQHFNPDLNPDEFHPTEHYGLVPNYNTDQQSPWQMPTNYEGEEQATYHHSNQQEEPEGSNRRSRKNKGKQLMTVEREASPNNLDDDFVNMLYHGTTFHGRMNRSAASDDSENEEDQEHESHSDREYHEEAEEQGEHEEEQQHAQMGRRRAGRPRNREFERDRLEAAANRNRFRQQWHARGLSTDVEPELLAEQIALWKGEEPDEAHGIGKRASIMIRETRPENQDPGYIARYSERMRKIVYYTKNVKESMNHNPMYDELKRNNKQRFDFIALEQAIERLHQPKPAKSGRPSMFEDQISSQMTNKVINAFKEQLTAKGLDLDHTDLPTITNEACELAKNNVEIWNIFKIIGQYLVVERGFDPEEEGMKIFMRRARLQHNDRLYHKGDKVRNKPRRRLESRAGPNNNE